MASSAPNEIAYASAKMTVGDLRAAGLSGLVAGAVMGVVATVIALFYAGDIDAWVPIKEVAGFAYGASVMEPGFDLGPVVIGVLVHFLFSAIFAIAFALMYRGVLGLPFNLGLPYLVGGIYGLVLWAGAEFVLLPNFNPVMADAQKPAFVLGHIAYGVALGMLYARTCTDGTPERPAG